MSIKILSNQPICRLSSAMLLASKLPKAFLWALGISHLVLLLLNFWDDFEVLSIFHV